MGTVGYRGNTSMQQLDGYFFNFAKMEAFRDVDYKNFNIRMEDCRVEIRFLENKICRYSGVNDMWVPWSTSTYRPCYVTTAYKKWLDEEIDKIVL